MERQGELVLDGPRAKFSEVSKGQRTVLAGGTSSIDFSSCMTVAKYEVYWQRPLVAYRDQKSGVAKVLPHAPLGYLTAMMSKNQQLEKPITLWPRLLYRTIPQAALGFPVQGMTDHGAQNAAMCCTLRCPYLWVSPLPRTFG